MTTLDKSVLAGMPLVEGWPPGDVEALLKEARAQRYAKGAAVFEQGGEAASFFLLLHGHLQVTKITPAGQQVVVRYVAPGELFGIAVQMGRGTYPATATAVVDCLALAWPSAAWPKLVARFPSLASSALQTVGSRLSDAHARVVEMSTEQVERRVAHALLRIANQSGRKAEGGIEITFPITRQDLAEMTGATLYTISRILSAWEADGLIDGGRQKIFIRAPHRLFVLAEGREADGSPSTKEL
ncbi:MAG TPA: Crp/Fnr family transcriptional regulator [Roseiarcus sp.]|nr:Crp/Fnr family transcriptional regulator [Roseiarcus sp.]